MLNNAWFLFWRVFNCFDYCDALITTTENNDDHADNSYGDPASCFQWTWSPGWRGRPLNCHRKVIGRSPWWWWYDDMMISYDDIIASAISIIMIITMNLNGLTDSLGSLAGSQEREGQCTQKRSCLIFIFDFDDFDEYQHHLIIKLSAL